MSKGENIFQRKDGRRAARCSKGYELPAVPPVRLLLRRVAARKADGGVRREKRPAPMFSTGAGRFFTEGRNPRYAESAEWAGFPRAYFGRSRAPPLRGRSGYSVGTGIPRLYPAERSRARRGIWGAPVRAEQSPAPTGSIWLFCGDGDSPFISGGAIPRSSGCVWRSCRGGALLRP